MKAITTNRRDFLKKAACAAAGTIAVPTILSSCAKGANNRVNIAHIGVGGRGTGAAKGYFMPLSDSRSLATCDPFKDRREKLAAEFTAYYADNYQENTECTPYNDFRDILSRADIDAVHIATGDYWHLPIAILAARAGKHIYCEKPLGLSLDNMIELEKIMNKNNLIFQYGTQQRSLEHIQKGTEMVRTGAIGKIEKVEVWAPAGEGVPQQSAEIKDPPPGLDYDMWLGPAPVKPYSDARVAAKGIYHIYDYAIGFIAGWGAHPLDVAVWGVKEQMNDTFTMTGSASFFPEDILFDTIDEWDMDMEYANGMKLHFVSTKYATEMMQKINDSNGTTFYGSKGWISLGRGKAASSDSKLHEELNTSVFGENNRHGLNFIKTIQGERDSLAPLDDAILSDCISHMGNVLIRSGKDKVVWNPVTRVIENYPELMTHFHRDLRAPYNV